MSQIYYTIPFKSGELISNKEHPKCNLKQSIVKYIHLINTTYFGECFFDESFGSVIWNVDFDNLTSSNRIREEVSKSLTKTLKNQEKRLTNVSVEVKIKQEELLPIKKNTLIKKKVIIRIKAKILKTNEEFFCEEFFYIAPLSY